MATKQKENKFIVFVKKFWVYIVAGFLAVIIGVTLGVVVATRDNQSVVDVVKPGSDPKEDQNDKDVQPGDNEENDKNNEENKNDNNKEEDNKTNDNTPVNTDPVSFAMPMSNASILVDYTDTKLIYNPTLDRWESHLYIDLTSSDMSVYSVLDGKVLSVDYDYLTGNVVKIEHSDGLVSVYSSLAREELVKVGDQVTRGQKIGTASNEAASSSKYGEHLEFTLLKDGKKIDPNNYLDLQSK